MSTDYGALADYLIALADQMGDGYTTDDDVVTIERIRAAAAALRALVADNKRLRDDADRGAHSFVNAASEVLRLRRKVARYVGEARTWRASAMAWTRAYSGARRRVLDEVERRLMEWQEHASNIGLDAMRAERLGEPFDYNAVPVADVRRVLQAMRDGGGE